MVIRIDQAQDHVDETATIRGWMYNKRGSGKIYFLQLRDGSGFMQGVLAAQDGNEEVMAKAEKLVMESSVKVTGLITRHPKQEGVFEMQVKDIEIVQIPPDEYPISKKEHGPDFLLNNRHLWLRSSRQWAIQRVRDVAIQAIYDFFHKEGFIKIDTPIITANACEGATTLFEIEYFDEGTAYLSQS
ncbi:MAG: OB-fold nucleic acid binding domain-containing protein, partial [Patescibacteria group bacterium]